MCLRFVELLHRQVEPRPRTVHVSSVFNCPGCDRAGLAAFKAAARNGDDLRPFHHRALKNLEKPDLLLADFGIHHFHLGLKIEADGFVERTRNVVFALVHPDDIYLIDVRPHGQGVPREKAWAAQDMLRILHDNWPETIARFRTPLYPSGKARSDADHLMLREAGVTSAFEFDGVVYLPPGGGVSTAGTSIAVRMKTDYLLRWVAAWEDFLSLEAMQDWARRRGVALPEKVELRLVFDSLGDFCALVEGTNSGVRLTDCPI